MVIAFANQKGGVGKTTLCMLFANYLAKKGYNVLVVDVDRQRSLVAQRKSDVAAWEEQQISYNVEGVDCENSAAIKDMMGIVKNMDAVVLIDTPGNVSEDGLIPIFTEADAIICPYLYEDKCLESTGVFIQVLEQLKNNYKNMNPSVIYVANLVDGRVGTQAEKDSWNAADQIFSNFGKVASRIPMKASLRRSNTFTLSKEQEEDVRVSFDSIIELLSL